MQRRLLCAIALLLFMTVQPISQMLAVSLERAIEDRPDDSTLPQIHVMYVLPSDGVDQQLDTDGTITRTVSLWNDWLAQESGGTRLRLDTYQGDLDITFFRLSATDDEVTARGAFVRDEIEAQLIEANFTKPDKIYAVYYGGGSTFACGGGAWPPELPGIVGALYLNGTPPNSTPCNTNILGGETPQYLEFAMIHEVFHTLGVVETCAPNHTLRGHTSDDPSDLMYAGDLPWTPSKLDIGHDDYWGHNNAGCLDLSKSEFMEQVALAGEATKHATPDQETCSIASRTEVTVTIINNTAQSVNLLWVDFECKEVQYAVIPPNQSVVQPTYTGHIWRIRDARSNQVLKEFTATKNETVSIP
jgi:hypothetical protein